MIDVKNNNLCDWSLEMYTQTNKNKHFGLLAFLGDLIFGWMGFFIIGHIVLLGDDDFQPAS